jgi:hypothetical protein
MIPLGAQLYTPSGKASVFSCMSLDFLRGRVSVPAPDDSKVAHFRQYYSKKVAPACEVTKNTSTLTFQAIIVIIATLHPMH